VSVASDRARHNPVRWGHASLSIPGVYRTPSRISCVAYPTFTPGGRMLRCRRMASPTPELPETRERHCPICRSGKTTPIGHVLAADGMIKVEHRCETCGVAFFFVRKPLT
jgi:hypothetical protein